MREEREQGEEEREQREERLQLEQEQRERERLAAEIAIELERERLDEERELEQAPVLDNESGAIKEVTRGGGWGSQEELQAEWMGLPELLDEKNDFVPRGRHSQDNPPGGSNSLVPGLFRGGEGGEEGGGGMPGWEEAHTTIISTVPYIPKAARVEWARVLTSILDNVCSQQGKGRKWLRLYILSWCVLGARSKEQDASAQLAGLQGDQQL